MYGFNTKNFGSNDSEFEHFLNSKYAWFAKKLCGLVGSSIYYYIN